MTKHFTIDSVNDDGYYRRLLIDRLCIILGAIGWGIGILTMEFGALASGAILFIIGMIIFVSGFVARR